MTYQQLLARLLAERENQSLDLAEAKKILQRDIDRQTVDVDSPFRSYYDLFKKFSENVAEYSKEYVDSRNPSKQNEIKSRIGEYLDVVTQQYSVHQASIELLRRDLINKSDADRDVAAMVPTMLVQTMIFFERVRKMESANEKERFLSQFPMKHEEEYHCPGGFSARLNPILMILNSSNHSLTSAYHSTVLSSSLRKTDEVHTRSFIHALFGINVYDTQHYRGPIANFSVQEVWSAYLDYPTKLNEQFMIQQTVESERLLELARLFDECEDYDKFSRSLKDDFNLDPADFFTYDEVYMIEGFDSGKVEEELRKRAQSYYGKGIAFPNILQKEVGGDNAGSMMTNEVSQIADVNSLKTTEMMRDILHDPTLSISEKDIVFTNLWIKAAKGAKDWTAVNILEKAGEKEYLDLLNQNVSNEEIRNFFAQRKYEAASALESLAATNDSTLFQDKFARIRGAVPLSALEINNKNSLLIHSTNSNYFNLFTRLLEDESVSFRARSVALIVAAGDGRLKMVEALLRQEGVNRNELDYKGDTALMNAAREGHLEVVKLLLSDGRADANVQNQGYTALMLAGLNGHTEVVEALLRSEIDVNAQNQDDDTALTLGAHGGHAGVVKALLQRKETDVTAVNKRGFDALMSAAFFGHLEITNLLLLDGRVDVSRRNKVGDTPLMIAVRNGRTRVVEALLRSEKFDVNAQNRDGDTALTLAVYKGHAGVVEALLQRKETDVTAVNNRGLDALMSAVYYGHLEITNLLISDGRVDVSRRNKIGDTILMIVAQGGHAGMVEALMRSEKFDVNAQNLDGDTALTMAVHKGYAGVVEALLRRKEIDVTAVNKRGFDALMSAAFFGHLEITNLLISDGRVDVSRRNKIGDTILMIAAQGGHAGMVEALMRSEKFDVNAQNLDGDTALTMAVHKGHAGVVEALLRRKEIDVTAVNKRGFDALMSAAYYGHLEITNLLLSDERINVNALNLDGDNALTLAVRHGHLEVVRALLQSGKTDVNAKGFRSVTPISMALSKCNLEMVDLLLTDPEVDFTKVINKPNILNSAPEDVRSKITDSLNTSHFASLVSASVVRDKQDRKKVLSLIRKSLYPAVCSEVGGSEMVAKFTPEASAELAQEIIKEFQNYEELSKKRKFSDKPFAKLSGEIPESAVDKVVKDFVSKINTPSPQPRTESFDKANEVRPVEKKTR